jgi:excisionase family DNA binding protein
VKLLFTTKEICEDLAIGRSTLYKLISTGTIQCVRVGRSIRIHRDEIEAFVSRTKNNEPKKAA